MSSEKKTCLLSYRKLILTSRLKSSFNVLATNYLLIVLLAESEDDFVVDAEEDFAEWNAEWMFD